MTEHPSQQRRTLKFRAKRTFFRFIRPCLVCTFFLILLSLLAQLFSVVSGGTFFYTIMDVRQFPMSTGIWKADATAMTNLLALLGLERLGDLGGLVFSIRYEDVGQVLVFPVAWRQVVDVVIIQGIVLLVTAPLSYGVLSHYRGFLEGRVRPFRALFGWYVDLRLTAKALAVQVILTVWRLLATLLCLLPGMFCVVAGSIVPNGKIILLLSSPVLLLGLLAGYYLYVLLLPARYVLARDPATSVPQAFSKGLGLLAGRHLEYFKLNFSFLPWHIISMLLYGVPDLFVIPYVEMSNFLFLDPPPVPENL